MLSDFLAFLRAYFKIQLKGSNIYFQCSVISWMSLSGPYAESLFPRFSVVLSIPALGPPYISTLGYFHVPKLRHLHVQYYHINLLKARAMFSYPNIKQLVIKIDNYYNLNIILR